MKKNYILLLLTFLTFSVFSQTIETIAGTGTFGFSGDYGNANVAELSTPDDIVIDSNGNKYITDRQNHRIRKIDVNGIITTIAGNGNNGSTGDGSFAVNAEISSPIGITIDNNDNIYFAETAKIRKIDTNGIITTIAGNGNSNHSGDNGLAINSELNYVYELQFDSNNNLIIGCFLYIRKIDTNGVITTIAGNGNNSTSGNNGLAINASLRIAQGIFVDTNNNIYFSDALDNIIRKIDTNGIITTIAGIGASGFAGDNGLATSAQLNNPVGITKVGNDLFFADSGNSRIRKIDNNGIITTYAGNGYGCTSDGNLSNATFKYPYGLYSNNNDIYITDEFCSKVTKITDSSLSIENIYVFNFTIFPNPTSNIININTISNIKNIEIYNNLSQLIKKDNNKKTINISNLNKGVYFVKATDVNGNFEIKKIVKN